MGNSCPKGSCINNFPDKNTCHSSVAPFDPAFIYCHATGGKVVRDLVVKPSANVIKPSANVIKPSANVVKPSANTRSLSKPQIVSLLNAALANSDYNGFENIVYTNYGGSSSSSSSSSSSL